MFEFTTQSVYNNISVATPDEIKAGAKDYNVIDNSQGDYKPYIRIGNTRFDKGQIVRIDVRNPSKEQLAKVTFDLQKIIDKIPEEYDQITGRIALYIGLSMNSQDSFYSNDFVYKGKPFFIEFPVNKTDSVDVLAKRVKKIADKYLLLQTQEKILDVIATANAAVEADAQNNIEASDATGEITFKGTNGYQQIRKAVLQWFNPEAKSVDCCTNQGDFENIVVGIPVTWTITKGETIDADTLTEGDPYEGTLADDESEVAILPGLEAFGDYNWIIHNLRLPTLANTHFWSPTKNEMPIPGQYYTQITVTMRDTNKGTAGNDIGQVTTCQTTHVLYVVGTVNTEAAASDSDTNAQKVFGLLKALTNEQVTPEDKVNNTADTKFNAPFEN